MNPQQQQHGLGSSNGLFRLYGLKLSLLNSELFSPSFTYVPFVFSASWFAV
jgi:hypothetical protein